MINDRIENKQVSRVSKLEIINKQRVDERKSGEFKDNI